MEAEAEEQQLAAVATALRQRDIGSLAALTRGASSQLQRNCVGSLPTQHLPTSHSRVRVAPVKP